MSSKKKQNNRFSIIVYLTPEDEERRRRRRERNKIAATKCRLKKRERTANLITESETLETQNIDLKSQVHELQQQKRSLEEVLAHHRPLCHQQIKQATRDALYKLPPLSSVMENHSYSRPNPNFDRLTHLTEYTRSSNSSFISSPTYMRNNHFKNPPTIIVEEIDDNAVRITNLDNHHVNQNYYNQCHNYPSQNYNNTSGLDNGCMA
ncbi:hypothetical protein HHI36_010982 [Cryptolaemus montrouzieri]|uniref:BZIP domain-containing protein n=1 Tax=Cryptolaemus montrouzieri TaxID=559131 RepID=A0ABD2MKA6_9CUCU